MYLTILISVLGGPVQDEVVERPKRQDLAQNEDWSVLRGVDRRSTGEFWDRIKFIPLNDDGSNWLSLGGQLRSRVEYWNGFDFGLVPPGTATTDTFWLNRVLFHADLHLGPRFRAFGEVKGAWSTDRDLSGGVRAIDADDADVQQLFFDYSHPLGDGNSLTLRPGRQGWNFGSERLVSRLRWVNTMRSWDGASAIWKQGQWSTTGFWGQFVPVKQNDFNTADSGNVLYGVFAEGRSGKKRKHDLYALGSYSRMAMFNGTAGAQDRFTLGGRILDEVPGTDFDYEAEAAYQFGTLGSANISAWTLALVGGYSFQLASMPSRAFIGYDYASGDDSPGGNVGTFDQLFPLAHKFLGYADIFGRQNVSDIHVGSSTNFSSTVKGIWFLHYFQLATPNDALYNVAGAPVIPGGTSGSRDVGTELDLVLSWRATRHLEASLGYSHFFAGQVPEDAGGTKDIDFVYAQLQYDF